MTPADGLPEEPKYWRYTTEGMDYAKPNSLQKWVTKQDYDALRAAYDAERRAGQELRERLAELDHSFELRWKADMRAIKRWQAATGKMLTWPDHADLCGWLMEQLEGVKK